MMIAQRDGKKAATRVHSLADLPCPRNGVHKVPIAFVQHIGREDRPENSGEVNFEQEGVAVVSIYF